MDLTLRIVLERPTAGVDFGLQSGHGNAYEIVQKQRSSGKDLKFELTIPVKPGRKDSRLISPDRLCRGRPATNSSTSNIGTYAGQTDTPWSRRLKITLKDITWDSDQSGTRARRTHSGTGKDGGPSCASEWRKRVGGDWGWQLDK
jgi:hypothetical protein